MSRNRTTVLNLAGALLALSVLFALVIMTSNQAHAASDFSGARSELYTAPEKIRGPHVPCLTDEGPDAQQGCVWDAVHRGNGVGHSFLITPAGRVVRISHARAHALTFGAGR